MVSLLADDLQFILVYSSDLLSGLKIKHFNMIQDYLVVISGTLG